MSEISALVASDLAGVELGDARLNARARVSAAALAARPAVGLPQALSAAELEGYYRFVNNEQVSFARLLASHREATRARTRGMARVIVVHDTTDFRFRDEVARDGLGPMDNGGQGFYAHVSVVASAPGEPVGVVAVEPWTRAVRARPAPRPSQRARYAAPDKESLRWMRGVHAAEHALAGGAAVVHVMDREADTYDILCGLLTTPSAFVVRARADRCLAADHAGKKLTAVVQDLEVHAARDAALGSRRTHRPAKDRRRHPPRRAGRATVTCAAGTVTICRPAKAARTLPAHLTLNVVSVAEPSPPAGRAPVEWILLTNQPVDTPAQVLQVVDDYRTRWTIEEYFKALKTGCAFETRQHESLAALLNTLGIFLPIAWALLYLRGASRDPARAARPATTVLTPTQLEILRRQAKGTLPSDLTARSAVLALARWFGGHLLSNGDPGWQVLSRAYQSLLLVELGWQLARASLDSAEM